MNEAKCKARAKSGEPCHANATTDGFCSIHSSAGRAAELGRRSGLSRRGPSSDPFLFSPPETARDLHRALGQIFAKVSSGEMDMRIGRSLGYIASVLVSHMSPAQLNACSSVAFWTAWKPSHAPPTRISEEPKVSAIGERLRQVQSHMRLQLQPHRPPVLRGRFHHRLFHLLRL